ncbi:DUF5129 domain-containing protein [Zhihengliuella salsuginis]|uniref:DUF5129 domain-containing protein n=1 Tax=Zhihengliuella salsuginis TaxID=578222 RepID=A0ABQ3GD56_9MICC|nr:DUF5129 domain-containing protein [Zhihengliuella salsuginis]GHD02256.1 hypothetical protein GCM10008096_07170 [Zhihengliuella salsuginis]
MAASRPRHGSATRSTTTARPVVAVLAALLVACGLSTAGLVSAAGPAAAAAPAGVEVVDTSDVLDDAAVAESIRDLDFHVATDVVVLTLDGRGANHLNEAVLDYARASSPAWISGDGENWSDGLFILAVDPRGRQVGTYFGDDREVSQAAQDSIQEATKGDFRKNRWEEGAVAGVEEAAGLIGRPWYQHPGVFVLGLLLVLGGLVTTLAIGFTRRGCRQRVEAALVRGDGHRSSVASDLGATEANAGRIPATSSYGKRVLAKYATFVDDYRGVLAEREELEALDVRARSEKAAAVRAEAWADRAARLDAFDDVVADAADLLSMTGQWQAAWKRQAAGFREDLDAVPGIVDLEPDAAGTAEAGDLLDVAGRARVELSSVGSRLTARQITAELALDELQRLRTELSDLFERYSLVVIDSYAQTSEEREKMQEEMASTRRSYTGSHANILDVSFPTLFLFHGAAFSSWHASGTSAVDATRSEGTSTGYGSGSGGFSGAGSSSSF